MCDSEDNGNLEPRIELMKIAKRIKHLRIEMGWNQKEFAEKMNCPRSLISYYEAAKKAPGYTNIKKMMGLFNESADYIMGETDERRVKKEA